MSDTPPDGVRYARYHRPGDERLDPDLLQALSDGYFGLSYVFVANVLMVLPLQIMMAAQPTSRSGWLAKEAGIFFWLLVMCVAIGLLSYRPNRRIGEGMGWSPGQVVAASLLLGINGALCCGVLGYAIMQSIASRRMSSVYKVRLGLFTGKRHVQKRIDELRAQRTPVAGFDVGHP
jgi:hypothetical protein